MEKLNRTLSEQTESLVVALEHILSAQSNILSSLHYAYGDEQGEDMYSRLYEQHFDTLKNTLKQGIGDSIEVNMGMLDFNLY